jgi:hypothetical protein
VSCILSPFVSHPELIEPLTACLPRSADVPSALSSLSANAQNGRRAVLEYFYAEFDTLIDRFGGFVRGLSSSQDRPTFPLALPAELTHNRLIPCPSLTCSSISPSLPPELLRTRLKTSPRRRILPISRRSSPLARPRVSLGRVPRSSRASMRLADGCRETGRTLRRG